MYQLYLPEVWANDPERRKQAGVPQQICFRSKPKIALEHIRSLVHEGVPCGVVLADADMATMAAFAKDLFLSIFPMQSASSLRPCCGSPGTVPLPPQPKGKKGPSAPSAAPGWKGPAALTAKQLALCLSAADLRRVSWREGTRGAMRSRFAALRVRIAHRDYGASNHIPSNGCWSNGRRMRKSLPNTGFRTCPHRSACANWSPSLNYAGVSSATTKS